MVYEFASVTREMRYRLDLGWRQLQVDMAVNGFFCIVVFVATLKMQLLDDYATVSQLLALWALQVPSLLMAVCPPP